jgi:serine/threonine protein kinase
MAIEAMLSEDLSGSSLGQYQIVERIGSGGMAVVYRAIQPSLGREVALKVLSPALVYQDGFIQRFENEARVLARLEHPHILPIHDFATVDGHTFIATPVIRGGTLRDRISGPLADGLIVGCLSRVADALDHAHAVGVVHRDLKPSNVLMHRDGRPVLADFGLARGAVPNGLTVQGFALGTPGYMAPEQAMGGEIDGRADVYALAVIAFELLTGSRPYPGSNAHELMIATLHEPVPAASRRNPFLPRQVDAVLARGLAKHADERPRTASQLIRELSEALAPEPPVLSVTPASAPSFQAMPAMPSAPDEPVRFALGVVEATPAPATPEPAIPAFASRPGPVSPPLSVSPPPSPLPSPPPERASAATPTPFPSGVTATLPYMGIKRLRAGNPHLLNSYFALCLHAATHAAGDLWVELLQAAGMESYRYEEPPGDRERTTPVLLLARLAEAFDSVFGTDAPERLRQWGRLLTRLDLERDSAAGRLRRTLVLRRGSARKLDAVLRDFARRLDEVRGESLHVVKQLDDEQFWVVLFANAHTLNRQKQEKSCHFWTAALEARLRWAGLANDWEVAEIECGAVTGSCDCVFRVRSARSL